jgi:CHASE2 domain-containing sensor protein
VVAFDVLFSEPDRTSPEQLLETLAPEDAEAVAGEVLSLLENLAGVHPR